MSVDERLPPGWEEEAEAAWYDEPSIGELIDAEIDATREDVRSGHWTLTEARHNLDHYRSVLKGLVDGWGCGLQELARLRHPPPHPPGLHSDDPEERKAARAELHKVEEEWQRVWPFALAPAEWDFYLDVAGAYEKLRDAVAAIERREKR
jgi:hypothetical protein